MTTTPSPAGESGHTPDPDFDRLSELFAAAVELPSDQHADFLDRHTADDPDLRARLARLLAHHADDAASDFLEPRAFSVKAQLDASPAGDLATSDYGQPSTSDSSLRKPRDRFLPGTTLLGRYRIRSLVGTGGMGEVYQADDLKLGQLVALKFLPHALRRDAARLEYFYNEVKLARAISHPNVCRVYDVAEVDGQHFLSMEYVDGEDLARLLKRIGRLPPDKGVQIAAQICAGLAAAHDQGVLHRDIKPSNVMLDGRGQVRITDFGIACLADETSENLRGAGTPAYMSPEQRAALDLSPQSDLFSLGLVLYELFTGETAASAGLVSQSPTTSSSHATPPPTTGLAELPPHVQKLIRSCLESDPALRPASAREMVRTLQGSDPFAAWLEAGQTPSPEVVAAVGVRRLFAPATIYACLAAVLLGLTAYAAFSDRTGTMGRIDDLLAPAALEHEARQIVAELPIPSPSENETPIPGAPDAAFGYTFVNPPSADSSDRDTVQFWYRHSPDSLTPVHVFDRAGDSASTWARGIVLPDDPPPNKPGMVSLRLDAQGRLLELTATPHRDVPIPSDASPPDWHPFFERAGLDSADFAPADATRAPPDYADHTFAWVPTDNENHRTDTDGAPPARIEAASLGPLPTYFRVVQTTGDELLLSDSPAASPNERAVLAGGRVVFFVVVITAAVLAYRSARAGRLDRKGGLRFVIYIFALTFGAWIFQADHRPRILHETNLLLFALATSLETALRFGLCYVALEPYVRRYWPETIVTWGRVLAGRLRDPLVAQDVLVGTLFGVLWLMYETVCRLFPDYLALSRTRIRLDTLLGARHMAAEIFFSQREAISVTLVVTLLLLLFRFVLRRRAFAAAALFILWTVLFSLSNQLGHQVGVLAVLFIAVRSATMVYLLTRFGLLATTVAYFVSFLLTRSPITADLTNWYGATGLFALGFVVALALAAAYFATASRTPHHRRPLPAT